MKFLSLLVSLFVYVILWVGTSFPASGYAQIANPAYSRSSQEYLEGTVIFKLKPQFRQAIGDNGTVNEASLRLVMQQLGAMSVAQTIPNAKTPRTQTDQFGRPLVDLSLIYTLQYGTSQDAQKAARMLLQSPAVDYAEPQYIHQAFYSPNDADTTNQYYLTLIRAYEAWDITHGDTNVVVGIIDTGTSFNHPDFAGKFKINYGDPVDGLDNDNDGYIDNWRGWDFGGDVFGAVGGDNNAQYVGTGASNDHGVLVGGVATAATDNNLNIASVGFNTRQLPVRVAVSNGLAIVYGYQGLIYAADHGADIINLSWGGSIRSRFGEDAVNYAIRNKGKMVVAAAGNTPVEVNFFPASYPDVLSVGGSQTSDAFWFNNSTFGSSFSYYIDLVAPARSIRTLKANSGVGAFTGTSLAAPIVCGAAALVKAAHPQYSNMQVAQRIRVSADSSIYAINSINYIEKMGRGRLDCYQALVDSSPSVRVLSLEYKDNDGYLRVGDTVEVWAKFINWLDPVDNLKIKLTSASTSTVTVLDGDWTVGHLGTLDTVAHRLCHFRIVLGPAFDDAVLRFAYTGTNYNDKEFYQLNMSPNHYINVDWNDVEFSASNTGEFGFTNAPTNSEGVGLGFREVGGILSEGGLLIATGPTNIADNITRTGGAQNNHFAAMGSPKRNVPGAVGDLEADIRFNTNGTGSTLTGIQVKSKIYEWRSNEDNGYAIMEYTFYNTTGSTLNNVHAALFADWDAGYNLQNQVTYVPNDRLIYVNDPVDHFNPYLFGMSLLTPDSLRAYARRLAGFGFTNTEKWRAMTSPPDSVTTDFDDIIAFLGTGPFSIAPGDSHTVAFAQVGGVDSTELVTYAQAAYQKYWCVVKRQMTTLPDLGPDIYHCGPDTAFFLNPGPGFTTYQWSTGSAAPTLTVDSIGTYTVTVTDMNGCSHHSTIHVEFHPGIEAGFTHNLVIPQFVGDTAILIDTTSGALETEWIVNGTHFCPDSIPFTYPFTTPGPQTIALVAANHYCFDTAWVTISVDTLVGLDPLSQALDGISYYPNPSQGSLNLRMENTVRGNVNISLIDLQGRTQQVWKMEKHTENASFSLQFGQLPNGIYLLDIQHELGRQIRRVELMR